MYLPIQPQPSNALAWLAAIKAVDRHDGHEAGNVIINVEDPTLVSPADKAIVTAVDTWLRKNGAQPLQTVANTIFPQSVYERHGRPAFYQVYLDDIWGRIKKAGDWGRYFERMISFPLPKKGKPINPLEDMIDKMKRKVSGGRCFMHVYELTIFDPIRDAGRDMNRQCMSFMSFHLSNESPRKLMLTAVYRNHYYTERLLGNLIGLGRLMRFIATEVDVEVGELTIVSAHALVDNPSSKRSDLQSLIAECSELAGWGEPAQT